MLPNDAFAAKLYRLFWDDPQENAVHTQTDSRPSRKLNPLAAGYQTFITKGETAYAVMI